MAGGGAAAGGRGGGGLLPQHPGVCTQRGVSQLPAPHQIFVAEIAEAEHRGLLLGLTVPVMAVGVLVVYGLGESEHSL